MLLFYVIRSIVFGGDQLTEERASNTQKGFLDGSTRYERLQGLEPIFEGWHTKRMLYIVRNVSIFLISFHSNQTDFINVLILEKL